MFVACPQCGFLVAAHAGGTTRCPRCGSALETKQAQPLEQARGRRRRGGMAKSAGTSALPAAAGTETTPPVPPTGGRDTGEAGGAIAGTKTSTDAAPHRGRRAPSFVRRHATAPIRARRAWEWMAMATLAALLALQLILAQREAVAASARWRPLVAGLCSALRCDLPPWREPAAFTMLQRSVQPKPDRPGVLHVSASFRNDARWAQPWPTVLLTLSDMDGRRVGQRAFRPDEYLSNAASGVAGRGGESHEIAPGQSAALQLDVVEPPERVVAFTFDFL